MNDVTKAKINIIQGTIELEGSEAFVTRYLDQYKEMLQTPFSNDQENTQKSSKSKSAPKKKPINKTSTSKASSTKKTAPKVSMERFDIHGGGDTPSLADYIEEKKPGTGNGNIIAVIGHYLTEILNNNQFSEGQIEYAYKMLKVKRPAHLHQIMINEKNNRDLFESDPDDNTKWELTRTGEIFVSDLLPES